MTDNYVFPLWFLISLGMEIGMMFYVTYWALFKNIIILPEQPVSPTPFSITKWLPGREIYKKSEGE
jgi:hypothetical protein